jgi:hypothetical protein
MKLCSFAKVPSRSFNFTLPLAFAPDEFGDGWRKR